MVCLRTEQTHWWMWNEKQSIGTEAVYLFSQLLRNRTREQYKGRWKRGRSELWWPQDREAKGWRCVKEQEERVLKGLAGFVSCSGTDKVIFNLHIVRGKRSNYIFAFNGGNHHFEQVFFLTSHYLVHRLSFNVLGARWDPDVVVPITIIKCK